MYIHVHMCIILCIQIYMCTYPFMCMHTLKNRLILCGGAIHKSGDAPVLMTPFTLCSSVNYDRKEYLLNIFTKICTFNDVIK